MSEDEYTESTPVGGRSSADEESGPGSSDDSGDAETRNPETRGGGPDPGSGNPADASGDSAQVAPRRLHGFAVRGGRAEWGDFYDTKGRLGGRGGPDFEARILGDFGPATCPPGCADSGHAHWKRDPDSAPVNPADPGGPRYCTEDGRDSARSRSANEERGDSRDSEDHGGPGPALNERILRRGSESEGPQRLSDVPRYGGGQKFWERRSTGRGHERDGDSSPGPERSDAEASSPGDSHGHTGEGQGEGGREGDWPTISFVIRDGDGDRICLVVGGDPLGYIGADGEPHLFPGSKRRIATASLGDEADEGPEDDGPSRRVRRGADGAAD